MRQHVSASPISFPVNVSKLAKGGLPLWLEADEAQRAALAEAHGLLGVESFRLDAEVTTWKRGGVRVEATIKASIVQACVVSLEPVANVVATEFEALLVPENSRLARPDWAASGEVVVDAEGDDAPETFSGDIVDVGELAEQYFELAIDPYPRAPGAKLPSAGRAEPRNSALADELRKLTGKS